MAFETRSLPTLPHLYPRDFTFYVTPPVAPFSISGFSFSGRTTPPGLLGKGEQLDIKKLEREQKEGTPGI
jgi:hypothetical protein